MKMSPCHGAVRGAGSSPNMLMNTSTTPDKKKRVQHCQRCENHDKKVKKSRHDCPLKDCRCDKCELTSNCQLFMKHQQRFWRWKKQTDTETAIANGEELNKTPSAAQRCDRCRNHGIFSLKKGHKGNCEFESCPCEMCGFITKRQTYLKYNQRVKRNRSSHQQTVADEEKVLPTVQETNSQCSPPLEVTDTQRLILQTSDAENYSRDFQVTGKQKEIKSHSLNSMSLKDMELEERKSMSMQILRDDRLRLDMELEDRKTMSMQLLREDRLRRPGLWPLVPQPLKPTPIFPSPTFYFSPSYIPPYPYLLLRERSHNM